MSQVTDETIREHQWCGFMGMVMKHIDARNMMVYLDKISSLVEKLVLLKADEYILSIGEQLRTEGHGQGIQHEKMLLS